MGTRDLVLKHNLKKKYLIFIWIKTSELFMNESTTHYVYVYLFDFKVAEHLMLFSP